MKVQLYLRHFPAEGGPLNNGVYKAMDGLAGGLACCGVEVTVLCEGAKEGSCQINGYTVRCFAYGGGIWPFRLSRSLSRHVERGTGGVVILNGIFSRQSYALSRVLRRVGAPYVVAPHDPYHPSLFAWNAHLKWPYWYLMERRMLRGARAIQVLDARHACWLRRLGIRTAVVASPNGFDESEVPAMASLRWRTEGTARVLFLGRLDAYNKGLDLLLEAMARTESMAEATLCIQGPDYGDKQRLMKQAERLGLGSRVRFMEADYGRRATEIMAEHDIVCLPSRFEGFGLAAMEAMLAGRVVVVSDVGGISAHVLASGCGVVVEAEAVLIGAGLRELMARRSQWRSMGLRGRAHVLEHLRWDRIAADLLEQYRRVMPEVV